MFSVNGTLMRPHRPSTPDMAAAVRSHQRYLNDEIESVICYHGGFVRDRIRNQLEELVEMNGSLLIGWIKKAAGKFPAAAFACFMAYKIR